MKQARSGRHESKIFVLRAAFIWCCTNILVLSCALKIFLINEIYKLLFKISWNTPLRKTSYICLNFNSRVLVLMLTKVLKFKFSDGFRAQGSGTSPGLLTRTLSEPFLIKLLHYPCCPCSMEGNIYVTSQNTFACCNLVDPNCRIILDLHSICNAKQTLLYININKVNSEFECDLLMDCNS